MHLLQKTPIPMDNASITQKLKGHELAVDFIGIAFVFCNTGERLAPACITFTTEKQPMLHFLSL